MPCLTRRSWSFEMEKSYEFTLLRECPHCDDPLPIGFARCRNPACGKLRPEFEAHAAVVSGRFGRCMWNDSRTDVRLPSGDYLWAPYFLDAVRAGWLDSSYSFTEKYHSARSGKRH